MLYKKKNYPGNTKLEFAMYSLGQLNQEKEKEIIIVCILKASVHCVCLGIAVSRISMLAYKVISRDPKYHKCA